MATETITQLIRRLDVMRVAIDALGEDRIADAVDLLASTDGPSQIVLLRWWDFMRARRRREYRRCVREAGLVVPVSRSVVFAAKVVRGVRPARYMPFDFLIRVLGALEARGRSIYLLGGSRASLRVVEQNVRETFPGLRVVGRYTGNYASALESDIITAIRKANPDFVLIGPGAPAGDRWVTRHRSQLTSGVFCYSAEVFDIFCDRRPRGSRKAFQRGYDFVPDLLRRPWRVLRFPVFLWFLLTLGIFRLFRR